jgi:protein-arginine kinase
MIIHISTLSSSNEIQGFIVVLIHLQLTLGCILNRCRGHVRFLYNLPNGMTLAQEIVASLVFPVTKILIIEDNELHDTFLHVTIGSQSQLRITSDLTYSDTN